MIRFISNVVLGIIRRILTVVFVLFLFYVGVFGLDKPHVKPFITNWLCNKVDEKKDDVKDSIYDSLIENVEDKK